MVHRTINHAALLSLWIVATSAAAAEPTVPRLQKGDHIVFLGDSITQDGTKETGFQTLLAGHLRNRHRELAVRTRDAGISGDKITDLQRRLERDVLAHQPSVVVVHVGINDVWRGAQGTPKDQYEQELRSLVARLQKAGARVVLCTPSVIGEWKNGANRFDKQLDEYAAVVRRVALDTKSAVCDLRQAFVAHLQAHNPHNDAEGILTTDGVHLNTAGNRLVAEQLATILGLEPLGNATDSSIAKERPLPLPPRDAGPKWSFKDGDRLYWNGSSHSQDEGWQASVVEFYLRTCFPQLKITSGRGGPTGPTGTGFAPIIDRLKPTVIFCEFGLYGGDGQVEGVVHEAERLAAVCQEKKVRLVMMPSVFRAAHIDRLPKEYKGLTRAQIVELNARKRQDGTLKDLGQEVPSEVHETHYRMVGAPGCDQRVAAMQAWGDRVGIFVPRTYQDQRDWLFKVWEKDAKFPWGGGHPPTPGYLVLGYFLLERMEAPVIENRLVLDAGTDRPTVAKAVRCEATELTRTPAGLQFRRLDRVLPVVPPLAPQRLPPGPTPMLKYAPYFLQTTGLPPGEYEIVVESVVLGRVGQEQLAAGVNLNEVYLRSGSKGEPRFPWQPLWLHCRNKNIDKDTETPLPAQAAVGATAWRWEVRRVGGR